MLVDLAHLQDEEVGDGTTSVVILAAELLKVKTTPFALDVFYQYVWPDLEKCVCP